MNIRSIIFPALLLLFFASLFLSVLVSLKVILLGLLLLYALLAGKWPQKLTLFRSRPHIWWMLGFAAWLLISAFIFSDNPKDTFRFLQLRIPLLIFPLAFGFLYIDRQQRNRLLLFMAWLTTFMAFACLVAAAITYIRTGDSAFLYNDSLSLLVGQQSIYTSLFVNISIYVFVFTLLFETQSSGRKALQTIALIFLFAFSYLLASRNMMLILYISTLAFLFYYLFGRKKYLEGATLLMGLFIAGFLVYKFFPKTLNRFKELTVTSYDYKSLAAESHYAGTFSADQWNGANFRLAAWPCGWQLFKEHPVTGVGLGDKRDELNRVYAQRDFQFAIKTKKNVHNNYLDILFSTGLIGFILFFTGWLLLPVIRLIRARDTLALFIVATLALAMITEVYFDRSLGAMAFGFLICFLLMPYSRQKDH